MEIKTSTIMHKIETGDFEAKLVTKKISDMNEKTFKEMAEMMVSFVTEALNSGRLAQVQLLLEGDTPVTFSLETTIINLPFSNWKKLNNFFDDEEAEDVNVYFEIASDYINVSKFRIDQFAATDDLTAAPAAFVEELATLMHDKLEFIKENKIVMENLAKEQAEAKKVAEANKKTAAKKKTTKKSTAKKTTTKKKTTKAKK